MRFQCPECGGVVAVDNGDLNTMVQCGHCSQIVRVPSSRVAPGCLVGDFIIRSEIGRGGMGVVYLAHQISLDRPAAVKVLADQYANNAEFVVGFIKEARAAAKLNHPHIVQAYAVGEDEGIFYFAMENIDGETMKSVLKREKIIPVDQAISIIQQIAEALNYAWIEQKLIHRDIKPDNIMLTSSGRAKLADLGLARVAGDIDDSEDDEVMGTPQYISPEHLTGAPMDVRSDIYSLGATFYHFVTGKFPFEGRTGAEIAQKHITEPLIPPSKVNPAVPECVSRIIEKMMAKNPIMRYQTAESLVDDLRIAKKMVDAAGPAPVKPGHGKTAPHKIGLKPQKGPKGPQAAAGKVDTDNQDHLFTEESVSQVIEAQKKEQRKMKMVISAIVIAVILVAGAVTSLVLISSADEGPTVHHAPKPPMRKKKPAATEASRTMNDILAYAALNQNKVEEVLQKCEKFLSTYAGPENEAENAVFPEFMALLSRADEKLIEYEEKRKIAGERREDYIRKRTEAIEKQEAAARLKAEREAAEKRKREELARQKAEQAARAKQILEAAKTSLPQEKADMMAGVFTETAKGNFSGAKKTLDGMREKLDKMIQETPQLKGPFQGQTDLLRRFSISLGDCAAIHEAAFGEGETLANSKLNLNGRKVAVQSITNGKLRYKIDKNKFSAIPIAKLPVETKQELVFLAADKTDKKDALFLYMLLSGDASGLKAVKGEMSPEELKATGPFVNEIRNALKLILENASIGKRDKLQDQFGKIPEFKSLF
ncbi:MAG: protein kinase [Lentisphaeria bacterium]|nr:protein kinase [Lentisphaeria bacterium]